MRRCEKGNDRWSFTRRDFIKAGLAGAGGLLIAGDVFAQGAGGKLQTTMAYASPVSFTWTPIYVARDKGYFDQEGIDIKDIYMKSAPVAMSAMLAGDAEFSANNFASAAQVMEKGQKVVSIVLMQNLANMEIVLKSDVAKEKGVTEKSPWHDRVMALKGLKIGISTFGGTPDMFLTFAVRSVGLDPAKDITRVPLGTGPANISGLKAGQVQAFSHVPPNTVIPAAEGFGIIVASAPMGDLKELSPIAYGAILAAADTVEKKPELCGKIARAVVKANKFIKGNADETLAILRKYFPKISEEALRISAERTIRTNSPDGRVTLEAARNAEKFLIEGKLLKRSLTDEELKKLFTNKFVS
jgi:NitT/TauT family transport system substrate-binding protein